MFGTFYFQDCSFNVEFQLLGIGRDWMTVVNDINIYSDFIKSDNLLYLGVKMKWVSEWE